MQVRLATNVAFTPVRPVPPVTSVFEQQRAERREVLDHLDDATLRRADEVSRLLARQRMLDEARAYFSDMARRLDLHPAAAA